MRTHFIRATIVIAAVAGVYTWRAAGAPILPAQAKLPQKVLSLAGIRTVTLQVAPMPPELEAVGLSAGKVTNQWKVILDEAGIEVIADDHERARSVPLIELESSTSTDEDLPGGVAFIGSVSVHQKVYVERLDRTMLVPTYVDAILGVDKDPDLAVTAEAAFAILVENFLTRMSRASAQIRAAD